MFTLDSNRWAFERSSGFAGYRCQECATWKYASEFLLCDCDKKTQFVIAGREYGEVVFWNIEKGWVDDVNHASTFPQGILGESLPPHTEGIMEITFTGEHVMYYPCTPPGGGGQHLC
jgi:hypothetical protein